MRSLQSIASSKLAWKGISLACGATAGWATQRALTLVWQRTLHVDVPEPAADRNVSWPAAVSWAIATGAGVAVARLVAERSAALAWEVVADETPPGVRDHAA